MYSPERFEFTTTPPDKADVTIDESTHGKKDLLRTLARGLSFPGYFGENWDALIDCLSDLSWSAAPEAILDHADLPRLGVTDLRLYLESLIDAIERRSPDELPRLRIVFRTKDRDAVMSALAASSTSSRASSAEV